MRVATAWSEQPCALLIALHADKSAASVAAFAARHPDRPIVAVVAGTDLYPRLRLTPTALATLQQATRIVALQDSAPALLPVELREKTRVIVQSAAVRAPTAAPARDHLVALVVGHLRAVKNPLLAAQALQLLPALTRLRVELVGKALSHDMEQHAAAAMQLDARFCWRGELPRREVQQRLAEADIYLNTSSGEGGASALSEAIAAGTPVLATAIPGNTGVLGDDWPGLFPPGDAAALAALLQRFEADVGFRALLRQQTLALQPRVDPVRERAAWKQLLAELGLGI